MKHQEFIRQVRPDIKAKQKKKELFQIPNKLFSPREYDRKIQYWVQILTEYSWHRASLSLSEKEISNCFHLEAKDCRKIIKHMVSTNLLKPYRDRYTFYENLKKLNRICQEEWIHDDYLTLYDIQKLTMYKFIDDKKHNQQIIQESPDFYFELKFQNNQLKGAKIRDQKNNNFNLAVNVNY